MTTEVPVLIDGVAEMAAMIQNFGVLIVATAILFFIMIVMFVLMIRQNYQSSRKNIDNFDKLLQHVINETPVCKIPGEQKEDELYQGIEKDLVNYHVLVNQSMKDRLHALRDICDADRTYVFTFHNSERSIADFPYLKASYYIDWSLWNLIENKISEQRDIPSPILTALCKALVDKGHLWSPCTEEIKEYDPMFYAWLQRIGARSFFARGLTDSQGRLIGFLGCDFTQEPVEAETFLTSRTKIAIDQAAQAISGIFDVRSEFKEPGKNDEKK